MTVGSDVSQRRLAVLGGAMLLLVLYAGSFDNGFHYDDFHSIIDNPHIRSLANVPSFFSDPSTFSVDPQRAMPRPLLLTSYALNYWFQEFEPWGWHGLNLLIHATCAWLVSVLAWQLGGTFRSAALAGFLFAVHPVNSEAVNYISSRSESFAALWYLASLSLYLKGVGQDGLNARASGWQLASAGCFAAALATKSSTIVLPVALLVYEVRRRRGSQAPQLRLAAMALAPHVLLMLGYLVYQRAWLVSSLGAPVRSPLVQLGTQLKAWVYYAKLAIVPVGLSVEPGFREASGLLQAPVVVALLLLLSVCLLLLGGRGALFCIWAGLCLLPTSIVSLNVLVNEHRLYLPLAFALIGFSSGFADLHARPGHRARWVFAALVVYLVVLSALTKARTAVWLDEYSLWQDAVRKAPGMYRAQMHWGGVQEQLGRIDSAVAAYRRAVELAPQAVEPWYNLGNGYRTLGQVEQAADAYSQALRYGPHFTPAMVNLAALRARAGDLAGADSLLSKAVRLKPDDAVVFQQLGILRRRQGHIAAAATALQRAVDLDPQLAAAHFNLGNLWFDLGRFQESAEEYKYALALDPGHAAAYLNLADLYLRTGQSQTAVALLQRAGGRVAAEPRLWLALGRAQEACGDFRSARQSYERFLQQSGVGGSGAAQVREHIRELRQAHGDGD